MFIEKEIIIGEGENAINVTAILNAIIAFVLKVVKFEFPEAGEIL